MRSDDRALVGLLLSLLLLFADGNLRSGPCYGVLY
jgi:hypothetical protein